VKVLTATGQLLVDGLDFRVDTVNAILEKLPSWFGPARPVHFMLRDAPADPTKTLAQLGVSINEPMKMVSAPRANHGGEL
jgi:hypothetical protein